VLAAAGVAIALPTETQRLPELLLLEVVAVADYLEQVMNLNPADQEQSSYAGKHQHQTTH